MITEPALRAVRLGKAFGRTVALADLDLDVSAGEIVGYLGPNGAGKTTTLRLALGMLQPTTGSVAIFGRDAHRDTVAAHRRLAYVPGEGSLWPSLTGGQTLELFGRLHGAVDERFRAELIERFALDPSRRVRAYSKGNRQKVLLIAALMTRADLLLLDEPTGGLDPLMEQEFRRCVIDARHRGQAVLLSSHLLSEVEAVCDRVAILRHGHLVEMGSLAELRHLSSRTVEVTFAGTVPDVRNVTGVSGMQVSGNTLRCHVRGSIQPLLRVLADSDVRDLLSREPSLEEVFLNRYGASDAPVAEPTTMSSTT